MNRCPPGVDSSFFSIPVLPGQCRQRHDPSRWTYGVNTVSTRFNTVHPGRAPLPGPPRFTTVLFDMSKTTGKTPGLSRSTRHHHGGTTVQPPVLPGSPRSMDRGEPGSTGSPVGLGHLSDFFHKIVSFGLDQFI